MQSNIKKQNWFARKFRSLFAKKTVGQIVIFSIAFILFALYSLSILYMISWSVAGSLKSVDSFINDPFSFPKLNELKFSNYVNAYQEFYYNDVALPGMLMNSLWYSVGGTFVTIACSTTMAYVVSKYKFPGRKLLYGVAIVVMTLPIMGTLPVSYKLIYSLHLNDSPLILLTFTSGFGMNFIILYGFFSNVSWSYAEAGLIDGAGDFKIFFNIMLPQALPAIVSLFIIAFIGVWNDYQGPYLYMQMMPTLSVAIFMSESQTKATGNYHWLFAALIMVMIPTLVLFVSFQEVIMTNTAVGGLKG